MGMKGRCAIVTLVMGLATMLGTRGSAQAPRGDRVLARVVEALGGREALSNLRTRVVVGRVEVLGGFPGTFRSWAKAPDKLRTHWDIRYIRQDRGFDGAKGWERHATVRELVEDDLTRLKREARFSPLLSWAEAGTSVEVRRDRIEGRDVYLLRFSLPDGVEEVAADAATYLPWRTTRHEPYEEGPREVVTEYGDYRSVRGLMLPFSVVERRPDLPLQITIERYDLDVPVPDSLFANPERAPAHAPYAMTLTTIPQHVYKERDGLRDGGWSRYWGIAFPPTESWLFNLVVAERYGRFLEPTAATVEFFSGSTLVKTESFPRAALRRLRKFPVTRYSPQDEIYDFRHHTSEPATLDINRLVYTLEFAPPGGEAFIERLEIPLRYYEPRTELIFPIRGNFIVTTGHEFYELGHKYEWSQHYSYDIVGLNADFALARSGGGRVEDFYTYRTREILAPADGVVVFARNDVPDGRVPADYLKMDDGLTAIGGNMMMIDHGTGEFSLFAHMHHGSVRFKQGDRVRQGDVLGLMGSSGSPGFPHLHYQVQASPDLFGADGLPARFTNLETAGWGAGQKVMSPRRGEYMRAK